MPPEDQSITRLLSTWGLGAKPCDACNSTPALLFCRPHAAFLCSPCDAAIHSASRHERALLCEVCEQSPASVTCKADAAALCSTCDRDIHSANPLAHRHERLPIVPFSHTPSDHHHPLSDKSSSDTFEDEPPSLFPQYPQGKLPDADLVFVASDAVTESFIDSGTSEFDFKSHVVPKHHLNLNSSYYESCFEIDFTRSKFSFSNQSVASSDQVGIVPDGISEVSDFQLTKAKGGGGGVIDGGAAPVQLSRADRVARVMRYREKRKNRKFEKTIRYASRKAYAETRPRIKGRFAKRADNEAEMDQIYGGNGVVGGFIIEEDMYGVVPSF